MINKFLKYKLEKINAYSIYGRYPTPKINIVSINGAVKRPCIGCVYFEACGSTTRTEPCVGRKTKMDE